MEQEQGQGLRQGIWQGQLQLQGVRQRRYSDGEARNGGSPRKYRG